MTENERIDLIAAAGILAGLGYNGSSAAIRRLLEANTPELDVRKIMLRVVPGCDGMGHEVYAKSVADVEKVLGDMGEELEDWQLGIKQYNPASFAIVPRVMTDDMAIAFAEVWFSKVRPIDDPEMQDAWTAALGAVDHG